MTRTDTFGAAWLTVAAATLLAVSAVLNNADAATLVILLAVAVITAALVQPHTGFLRHMSGRSLLTVVVLGLALETIAVPARAPVSHPVYWLGMMGFAGAGVHAVLFGGRWRDVELITITVGVIALLCWMVSTAPVPDIDVYVFQQEGSRALLHGVNPFALQFDVNAPPGSPSYAPELIEDGRTTFGFIYPPVSLLLAFPGYAVAGDYRYGSAVALGLAVVAIALVRRTPVATGAALLLLFAPGSQQVVYWGWTDPFVVLLLALTVVAAVRSAGATPWALGLFIASKQYVAPLYLLALLLMRDTRHRVGLFRMVAIPAAVAITSVAPFLLWDLQAFIHSTVETHLLQPFRPDSLSIPALLYRAGLGELPSVLGFMLAGVALLVAMRWGVRSVFGFCVAGAFVLVAFILFSKQAFMHYYFLALAALVCGVAAIDSRSVRKEPLHAEKRPSVGVRRAVDA